MRGRKGWTDSQEEGSKSGSPGLAEISSLEGETGAHARGRKKRKGCWGGMGGRATGTIP